MTSRQARTVANLVLVSAGVAAAYVVFTTPPLRRLASRASRSGSARAFRCTCMTRGTTARGLGVGSARA